MGHMMTARGDGTFTEKNDGSSCGAIISLSAKGRKTCRRVHLKVTSSTVISFACSEKKTDLYRRGRRGVGARTSRSIENGRKHALQRRTALPDDDVDDDVMSSGRLRLSRGSSFAAPSYELFSSVLLDSDIFTRAEATRCRC